VGVSTKQLPHVFDRFWQATPKARLGSGLGLTLAKGIVEALGGRIWADSQPGQGTTFFFTLPRASTPQTQ
jgi:signal transduction histidine kinase